MEQRTLGGGFVEIGAADYEIDNVQGREDDERRKRVTSRLNVLSIGDPPADQDHSPDQQKTRGEQDQASQGDAEKAEGARERDVSAQSAWKNHASRPP